MEQFLYLGPFGSMWSFLWSSSQVFAHLVGICSFLVLVCCERRWISWTRIHVFHHVLSFDTFFSVFLSNSIFISALGPSSSPSSSLVILLIHLPLRYAFSVAIFSSKILWFPWRLVVGMFFVSCPPNCW